MDSNPLEDLLGPKPEEQDPHAEQPTEEQPEAEAQPEPEAPPAQSPAPEPAHAPISALLDEREKRQAAERKARALEDRWARAQREAQPPPSDAEVLQAALYAQNLRASRKFAEREYGKDLIATVHDWAAGRCDADPTFNAQMRSSDDPYEAAMQAYNRETIAAKVTPERLAAFEAWEAAQAQAQQQQPTPQQPAATPPRSLVNAPGTGLGGKRDTPPEEGAAYAAAIPR